MKFNVNSAVSILSVSNSTLELFNRTNATVTVEVSNTSVLSQITSLDKSFTTNATRTGQQTMSTTESLSLNETITKPVVLYQNLTSSKSTEPSTTRQSSTNVFQETTGNMKEKTFQTIKETQKQTSEFQTSTKPIPSKRSLSSEVSNQKDHKLTTSTSSDFTKQQNSNIIFSTKSFTIKETEEHIKNFQTSPQTTITTTTPPPTTPTTTTPPPTTPTTITTSTSTIRTTTKTTIGTLPPPSSSTTNTITTTETILKEKKTKEKTENTTPKSTEISNSRKNKPQIKETTPKILDNTTANKINNSRKIATKLYRKYSERPTSNGINSSKYKRIKTEKLVETTTLRGKLKVSTPVSANSHVGKTISKTPFQRLLKNDFKQNFSSKSPAAAYGGIKLSTMSHFQNSQYSIDNENIESTTTPNITMGAGPLVIVVLLPFLALFLIAIVTALRRKMKKSRRRIIRVQSKDFDNTSDRNQGQMIPLTKPEAND